MEGGVMERVDDERIGNKRGREEEKGNMGRLEKRPSGIVVNEEHNGEEMINGVKYEEEKKNSGGLFNQLITNLVNSPRSDHQAKTDGFDGELVEKNGDSSDNACAGGGGGVINNLISNIFQSNGSGGAGEEVVEDGGDGGGEEKKEDEKNGGGSIIDHIVSQLPRTLSEDAAPATDEASILIHSIIHD